MQPHPGTLVPEAPARPDEDFFSELPVSPRAGDTFDPQRYRPAPDSWALVVTDIVDSTVAVGDGRHKSVNYVAAMAIAALRNLCAPTLLPFLFGGDGSVVMVPPSRVEQARVVLARLRGEALREFGFQLRVGLAPVGDLRRFGCDVLVGRFEPTRGNSFGVFAGGGIATLEAAVRGKGDPALQALSNIPESLDDGQSVDLGGLSCRWDPLQSGRGCMLTLIIHGAAHPAQVHAEVMRLAGGATDANPVRLQTLRIGWPPKGFMLEARATRRGGLLWWSVARVLVNTLVARIVLGLGRPVGGFVPAKYLDEVTTNTDFCKHDETVSFVIDCPLPAVDKIKAYLDDQMAAGSLRYGAHVSQTALMTCLVSAVTDGLHVHFVDGGDGGYTIAAKGMKALARAPSLPAG